MNLGNGEANICIAQGDFPNSERERERARLKKQDDAK